MSRSTDKRSMRDTQRPSRGDPEQLCLHFDDDFQVLLSDSDDDPRSKAEAIQRLIQNYDIAALSEASQWIIFEAAHQVGAELGITNRLTAEDDWVTLRNWLSHQRISPHRPVAEQTVPPKRAEMLLHFALPKRDRECMIGDLEEEYRTVILPKYGAGVAVRWYWWQAVRSVIAAFGGRVRAWLSFGGLARAAGWIVEKFTL